MTVAATGALAIAGYLTWAKVVDMPTVCGPLAGCATVASSPWSEVLGVPVALFGVLVSMVTLVGSLAWWRTTDRRGLWAAWLVGLASLPVLLLLSGLELFVIRAVCDWCVAYAVLVLVGLAAAAVAIRQSTQEPQHELTDQRPPRA
jgi:uncharacterized membrane protein